VRLEGLGHLKKSNDLIGNRTRELPTHSIVPQATTLARAPNAVKYNSQILKRDYNIKVDLLVKITAY
jgi:hypothetical protein